MEHPKKIKLPSKFEIRTEIIKNLGILKNNCTGKNLNKVIKEFKKIQDRRLLLSILIKELCRYDKNYDNIIKILITDIFGEESKDELQKALLDEKNSDGKKLFIINILREFDTNTNHCELFDYIKNPSKLLDDETLFFLHDAIKSPSKQIDLLDFLYGSNKEDFTIFLQYIIENYSEDKLANILSLSSFVVQDNETLKYIIKELGKTKSYYGFEALEYIQSKSNNKEILNLTDKTKNKLILLGLNKEKTGEEISKEMLSGTTFYEAKVSLFDSRGDFILVFSRINKNNCIDVFFTAFNLLYGILACFGFEGITKEDYQKTIKKIFNNNLSINIKPDIAKIIIDDAIKNGDRDIPYEILSWRRLTYDIPAKNQNNILDFPKDFDNFKLNKNNYHSFLKKDYLKTWFIEENENPHFKNMLLDIKTLDTINSENIKEIVNKYTKEIFDYKICFSTTLLMQAYFLYLAAKEKEAKTFYTIVHDNNYFNDFCVKILHKSIYKHFLHNNLTKKYLSDDFLCIMEQWQKEF